MIEIVIESPLQSSTGYMDSMPMFDFVTSFNIGINVAMLIDWLVKKYLLFVSQVQVHEVEKLMFALKAC